MFFFFLVVLLAVSRDLNRDVLSGSLAAQVYRPLGAAKIVPKPIKIDADIYLAGLSLSRWILKAKLGPKWPQNGLQNGPKVVQKVVQKTPPQKVNFKPILGPKMDPKMGNFGGGAARANPAGAILEALVSKMVPRWLKMASSSPR